MNILCVLGIHKWEILKRSGPSGLMSSFKKCKRCPKRDILPDTPYHEVCEILEITDDGWKGSE